MSGIVEFLRARLDEDERRCMCVPGGHYQVQALGKGQGAADEEAVQQYYHRFQPEWMLQDLAAKRAIIRLHRSVDGGRACRACLGTLDPRPVPGPQYPCTTLHLLSSAYADHPEYRPEWKV